MKRLLLLLTAIVGMSMLSACGSSPYKKRKACRGNGSWYGNRNLSAVDQATPQQNIVLATEEIADL